jgi:hypothetical protein
VPPFPPEVKRLLWDVDPDALDPVAHRDFVIERVMSRGTLVAMRWLRQVYEPAVLAGFLERRGERLSPRDRAYWRLVCGLPEEAQAPGGGRPPWLG